MEAQELTRFGRILAHYISRAGMKGPEELISRMREAGYDHLTVEELEAEMDGSGWYPRQGMMRGMPEALGLSRKEASRLALSGAEWSDAEWRGWEEWFEERYPEDEPV